MLCLEFVPSIMEAHKLKIYFLANQRSSWDPIDQLWCWILLSIWLKMSILWSLSYYSLVRGLNSPFRTTKNVEILNIICCRQEIEILSTVVLFKNLMIYLLKLFINKSWDFDRAKYKARFVDAASALISGFLMGSQDDLLHWIAEVNKMQYFPIIHTFIFPFQWFLMLKSNF